MQNWEKTIILSVIVVLDPVFSSHLFNIFPLLSLSSFSILVVISRQLIDKVCNGELKVIKYWPMLFFCSCESIVKICDEYEGVWEKSGEAAINREVVTYRINASEILLYRRKVKCLNEKRIDILNEIFFMDISYIWIIYVLMISWKICFKIINA